MCVMGLYKRFFGAVKIAHTVQNQYNIQQHNREQIQQYNIADEKQYSIQYTVRIHV